MMTSFRGYRVNPVIADFEDFGDEIVVIETASGAFYSLRGRAVDVWRACVPGLGATTLEAGLAALPGDQQERLRAMLEILCRDRLLEEGPEADTGSGEIRWSSEEPPGFEKNEDMNDLIKLDPIHDVDPAGWPHRSEEG